MRLEQVLVPETQAAVAAREVASEYCSPSLLNHSHRAYAPFRPHAHRA